MHSFGRFFFILLTALLFAAEAQALPTIIVDAGHGGHDRGGVPGQRYSEKLYALDVATRAKALLQAAGFRVKMTRSGDYFVGLGQRCAIANAQSNAVFVSVHFNSAPREGANGIETYYYSAKSRKLADALHSQILRAAGTENRFVRQRGFYVLRRNRLPAVLCELGFLTNGEEGGRIASSSSHRQSLATAIANGVIAVYK